MKELKKQIEKTTEIIKEGEYQNHYVNDDTILVLENQLIILKTLKTILENDIYRK